MFEREIVRMCKHLISENACAKFQLCKESKDQQQPIATAIRPPLNYHNKSPIMGMLLHDYIVVMDGYLHENASVYDSIDVWVCFFFSTFWLHWISAYVCIWWSPALGLMCMWIKAIIKSRCIRLMWRREIEMKIEFKIVHLLQSEIYTKFNIYFINSLRLIQPLEFFPLWPLGSIWFLKNWLLHCRNISKYIQRL